MTDARQWPCEQPKQTAVVPCWLPLAAAWFLFALAVPAAPDFPPLSRAEVHSPETVGEAWRFLLETPDEDITRGAELAILAFFKGAMKKAGIVVPTVSGQAVYPSWVHPYDNYWMNQVTSYFFPRESTEWPIRLFAVYQSPIGEIGGGVYDIPDQNWPSKWEAAGGREKWQPYFARPTADHLARLAAEPEKIQYGIYVRDHLFVLQAYDQWRARGNLPFLIEIYPACRRALKYLETRRDADHNGLIETTAVLSDLVVAGDADIHSTERAEDQVMLYGALLGFAEMAETLGGDEDAAWAKQWAARIKSETNKIFWRPEGRYIFGVTCKDKSPRLEYVTTTFANGYAILFGLADAAQTTAILDFMKRQEFVVPGPYHIPPVRVEDKPRNPPGVYCNGGCGWGRGIMPSVAIACLKNGRVEQGVDYLKRQGAAARKAGSFHEYWTWEKYAGETKAGGAPWYSETSAGFLDVLLHGVFGLSSPEPGFKLVQLSPHFPTHWPGARLELMLPSGRRLALRYAARPGATELEVNAEAETPVEVVLPWAGPEKATCTGDGLLETRVEPDGKSWRVTAHFKGRGDIRLSR